MLFCIGPKIVYQLLQDALLLLCVHRALDLLLKWRVCSYLLEDSLDVDLMTRLSPPIWTQIDDSLLVIKPIGAILSSSCSLITHASARCLRCVACPTPILA